MPENISDYKSLINAIRSVKSYEHDVDHIEDGISSLKDSNLSDKEWVEVVIELIKKPHKDLLSKARNIVDDNIKFKKYPNGAVEILTQLKNKPDFDGIPKDVLDDIYDDYKDICEEIDDLKQIPAGKKAANIACDLAVLAVTNYHPYYSACVAGLDELMEIGFQNLDPKLQKQYIDGCTVLYSKNLDGQLFDEDRNLNSMLNHHTYVLKQIKVDDEHKPVISSLFKMFQMLGKEELTNDEGETNAIGFGYFAIILGFLVNYCHDKNALPHLKMFLPACTEWRMRDTDDMDAGQKQIQEMASTFAERATETLPELAGQDHVEDLVKMFLKRMDYSLASNISTVYSKEESSRPVVEKYVGELVAVLEKLDDNSKTYIMQLFWEISQKNPKVLEPHIDKFEPYLEESYTAGIVGQIYTNIAKNNPKSFKGKGQRYFDRVHKANLPSLNYCIMPVFQQIATINESEAERAISSMENEARRNKSDKGLAQNMLYYWGIIAQQYPEPLRKRISHLKEMLKIPDLKQSAQHVIDVLEGRSLAKVSKDVEQQQDEIDELDNRVTQNEDDIDELSSRADRQEEDLGQARRDITENQERVEGLEGRVDDVEEDIVELDSKTVSNAPSWSKEVSRLLNPRSSKDYRLVAQRLGYSPEDIRGWAMQPDPTMSMLAELYTTCKTSEATHFLLNVLKEIDRQDVVKVIERSQRDVQDVVHDKPKNYKKPPPVFLSYQWGHQNEVKLLKHYLEKDGFACWMDVGQMGGGDSLYEEIDDGIRSCKVVVACLSEKYCKSPNCIREVNLSNGLGKRIIPLQMEKISWPPPGSLGPIMAEKLYIRFYRSDYEASKDERYWTAEKYTELVEQLKEKVEPDASVAAEAVGKPLPHQNSQAVKKPVKRQQQTPIPEKDYPSIFISYQWKHKSEVQLLKDHLQTDGFSCWMDIGQMGGGDSLYEEIDQGIRHSQVVLTCLNTKYPLSENCTKEVFLADALSKPIIVLLTEAMKYPPEGRQSQILTKYHAMSFFHGNQKTPNDSHFTPWPQQNYEALVRRLKEVGVNPDQRLPSSMANGSPQNPPQAKQTVQNTVPNRRRRPPTNSGTLSPINKRNQYDAVISCSPDSAKDMTNLALSLRKHGYETNVVNYTVNNLYDVKCQKVIFALSARYTKSKLACDEVLHTVRMNRQMIPLIMDDAVQYPLEGSMKQYFDHVKAINCTTFPSGANWDDTVELERILERLYNPQVDQSNQRNHVRFNRRGNQHIPRRHDYSNEVDEYSTSEERKYAKHMQSGLKLPQLDPSRERRRKSQPETRTQRSPITDPRREGSGSVDKAYGDFDLPKLPSVYRQRFKVS